MKIRTWFVLTAIVSALVGCSSASTTAITLKPSSSQGRQFANYYACPRAGQIEYVSGGFYDNTIYVFAGKLAGQSPCAQFFLGSPFGIFVEKSTHDLYVAAGDHIAIFHRGQTTEYKGLHDPTVQMLFDVTVAPDGTVIATNDNSQTHSGFLSTWHKDGMFVGNFPIPAGEDSFVTAQKDGKVYFNDFENNGIEYLYRVKCPAGRCGIMTRVAGVTGGPVDLLEGLGSDNQEDIIMVRQRRCSHSVADTFELPNPKPKSFPVGGCPEGLAMETQDRHLFVTESAVPVAAEYSYPAGKLVGTVRFSNQTFPFGVAVDPPHDL
jgi:hypothetical protein